MKQKILIYSSSRADIDRYIPIIKKILKENLFQPIIFFSSFHKKKISVIINLKLKNLKLDLLKIILDLD